MLHRWTIVWIVALMAAAGTARAQGPAGGGGGDWQQMRQQMERFREQHKYTMQLRNTVVAIGEMDRGTKCPLTADQARKVTSILTPLKKKPRLTQDEAKAVLKNLRRPLNTKQLTEIGQIMGRMEKERPAGGRPGGGGPGAAGGGNRPGGGAAGANRPGGGPGGQRPTFDPAAMKDYNPFAPAPEGNAWMQRGSARLQETVTQLENKAKRK